MDNSSLIAKKLRCKVDALSETTLKRMILQFEKKIRVNQASDRLPLFCSDPFGVAAETGV